MITGLAAGLVVAAATGLTATTPLAAYAAAAGAALLPDLDQPRSMANRTVATKPAHLVLRNFSHRGFTHSLLAIGLFAALLVLTQRYLATQGYVFTDNYVYLITAGYASHIFADMWNKEGVMLFYPFCPFGRRFWSVPLPRALRISTIYKPAVGFNPWSFQSLVHTEKLFWTYPMLAIIGATIYYHYQPLFDIGRHTLMAFLTTAK